MKLPNFEIPKGKSWGWVIVFLVITILLISVYLKHLEDFGIQEAKPSTVTQVSNTETAKTDTLTENYDGGSGFSIFDWTLIILLIWYLYIPLGVYFVLFVFGIPLAYLLENNSYRATNTKSILDKFGFFTILAPGRAKLIVRGDDIITILMNFPGHTFKGMRDSNIDMKSKPEDYWEVVEEVDDKPKYELIPFPKFNFWLWKYLFLTYVYPWWMWKIFIFKFTRRIFTGIWPIQTVFIYAMQMWDGKEGVKNSISDHVRVEPFDYNLLIRSAGTKDRSPVRIEVTFTAIVTNPYKTAFKTDSGNWSARINNFLPGIVDNYTRGLPLDIVYASSNSYISAVIKSLGATEEELQEEIREIVEGHEKHKKDSISKIKNNAKRPFFHTFGIKVNKASTPDRSVVDKEMAKKLLEAAIAKAIKEAAITEAEGESRASVIRSEGQAKAIENLIAAAAKHGSLGELIAQIERDKTVTANLPDGSNVILSLGGKGSGNDETLETLKAMLAKLNDLTNAS
ncbi:MAG: SPFH domain-containing protein [Candidatus Paceibacterota bacterium]